MRSRLHVTGQVLLLLSYAVDIGDGKLFNDETYQWTSNLIAALAGAALAFFALSYFVKEEK